ncbi:muconolactone Delta-isomerase family protein [Streptomyces sp. NPDC051636]|uniref:muconolactone Delta-isomerase family protein n=1 Tax=Streptomyces sp. NPDC051636 TaxID=3365663 RepID=UPI00378E4E32
MREFLVEITTTVPEGTGQEEVDRRRAADGEELHEKALGTLPLRPWTTLGVTPLEPHPNDPGRTGGTP